jgi:hypothetical protein
MFNDEAQQLLLKQQTSPCFSSGLELGGGAYLRAASAEMSEHQPPLCRKITLHLVGRYWQLTLPIERLLKIH